MPDIVLQPIVEKESQYAGIREEIIAYFREVIFQPLFDLLDEYNVSTKENAKVSAVISALGSGKIYYNNGTFTGKFNAAISKELRDAGATWDKVIKAFHLPVSRLPNEIRAQVADNEAKSEKLTKDVLNLLGQMETNVAQAGTGLDLKFSLNGVFVDLRKQYKRSLEAKGLSVPPDLTEETKKQIEVEYTKDLDKYVKDFTAKMIPEMRTMVQDNAFEGARPDKLSKIIQGRYGVSKRKAQFLADQETSLLLSKYRESRYRQLGSRRYVWSTSQDVRVRHDHEELNGKVFFWDSPPITNKTTGARNNPGEDFGCRCVARPILPIQEED